MLAFFRRRMKLILWILVVVVIVTFIPWGVGVRLRWRGERGSDIAGELFGKKVSRTEYNDAYTSVRTNYILFRSKAELNEEQIKREAWERLIMLREAARQGITVPDKELAQTIRMQFGREGGFNQEVYENVLKFAGIGPDRYEEWTRESLIINRLQGRARQGVWLPDAEIERKIREEQTTNRIRYVLVKAADLEKSVNPSDEEVKKFHGAHAAEYTSPPRVSVRYLFIPWSSSSPVAVTDESIKAYYEEHPDEFSHDIRLRARGILLKVEGKDRARADADANKKAIKILSELRNEKDFARLAKKYSQDDVTRKKGGDLGLVESKDMSKALWDKASALKAGEVTDPVKDGHGYHLVKVEEIQQPGAKPLQEVRESIKAKLEREGKDRAGEEARQAAYAKAVDLSLALVDAKNADEIARKQGVALREAGPFAERDTLKEISPSGEFIRAAFQTEVGSFSDIVEIPDKAYCIILPKEKFEAKPKTADEARGEIVKKLREEKARHKAHELAAARRAEVDTRMKEARLDFAAACKALGVATEESAPFQAGAPIPGLGLEPAIASAAAKLPIGAVSQVFDIKTGSCFLAVTGREEPSEKKIAQGIEGFRRRAMAKEERRYVSEWNRWLHEQARQVDYTSIPAVDAGMPPDVGD
ncbi:MAG: peptidyl-prolyl cis-trans isomerase [Candidatus Aureabacteria bacterium]|nr:peptidyl-prolyl cis-trans isomerase [Candidatus Auribacterota bacterium]